MHSTLYLFLFQSHQHLLVVVFQLLQMFLSVSLREKTLDYFLETKRNIFFWVWDKSLSLPFKRKSLVLRFALHRKSRVVLVNFHALRNIVEKVPETKIYWSRMLQHILALTRISETPVASFIFIMAPSYVVIFRSCSSPDNTGFWSVWRHTKKTCVRLFQSYGLFLVQIYDCFYLADSCHSISSVRDNLTTCTLMRNGMKVIKLSLFST